MANANELQQEKQRILRLVSRNPYSSDLILTLFHASTFSDRYETRADPFPPAFINAGNKKDVKSLRSVLDKLPPLSLLRKFVGYKTDVHCIDLLSWLYTTIDPSRIHVTEMLHLRLPVQQQPNVVFTVKHSDEDEEEWNQRKRNKNTLYGFYGTNLENMYSILNNGLDPAFSTATVPLYGEGLFLTTQVATSLLFSTYSDVWKYSMLGEKLKILVYCEIINDTSKVKRLKKDPSVEQQSNFLNVMVKDKNYTRVKYLFVYMRNSPRRPLWSKRTLSIIFHIIAFIYILIGLYDNRQTIINGVKSLFY